jgi:hypothetical protein
MCPQGCSHGYCVEIELRQVVNALVGSTDAMLVSNDDQSATERLDGETTSAIGNPTHGEDQMSTEGANAVETPDPVVAGSPLVSVLANEVSAKNVALATTSSSYEVALKELQVLREWGDKLAAAESVEKEAEDEWKLAINSDEGTAKEQVKTKWEDAIDATAHVSARAERAGYNAAQLRVTNRSEDEAKAKEDVAASQEKILLCLSNPLRNDINAFQPSARVDVLGMTKHQVHSSTNRFSMFSNFNSDGKDMWVQNGKMERLSAQSHRLREGW